MHKKYKTSKAVETDEQGGRREFLTKCGMFAAVTPPTIAQMLSAKQSSANEEVPASEVQALEAQPLVPPSESYAQPLEIQEPLSSPAVIQLLRDMDKYAVVDYDKLKIKTDANEATAKENSKRLQDWLDDLGGWQLVGWPRRKIPIWSLENRHRAQRWLSAGVFFQCFADDGSDALWLQQEDQAVYGFFFSLGGRRKASRGGAAIKLWNPDLPLDGSRVGTTRHVVISGCDITGSPREGRGLELIFAELAEVSHCTIHGVNGIPLHAHRARRRSGGSVNNRFDQLTIRSPSGPGPAALFEYVMSSHFGAIQVLNDRDGGSGLHFRHCEGTALNRWDCEALRGSDNVGVVFEQCRDVDAQGGTTWHSQRRVLIRGGANIHVKGQRTHNPKELPIEYDVRVEGRCHSAYIWGHGLKVQKQDGSRVFYNGKPV